jgi:uncharacterized protein YpmS
MSKVIKTMKKLHIRLLLVFLVLVVSSIACSIPSGQSTLPPTQRPLSTEDIQKLEDQIKATLESPDPAGDVNITITQDQLNGIITSEMAQQADPVITSPSVVLTNGQMEVYGKVTQSGFSANLKTVLQPRVEADGTPKLDVVSINLGGIPVPDALKDRIGTFANDSLANYLNSNQFKVKAITIDEGQMTVAGTSQ